MRPTTEPERLSARWDAINRRLEQIATGRSHTPEHQAGWVGLTRAVVQEPGGGSRFSQETPRDAAP